MFVCPKFILVFVFGIVFVTTQAALPKCRKDVYSLAKQSRRQSYTQGYSYSCSLFGWIQCRGTRTQYRTVYYLVTIKKANCCPSYSGTWPDCIPICKPACVNGGQCKYKATGNYCSCVLGYNGAACENIQVDVVVPQPECKKPVYRQITKQLSRRHSYSHLYTYSCGIFGWGRCDSTRTQYRTGYYSVISSESYLMSDCCSSHSGTWPHCTTICKPACSNGGQCKYRAYGNFCHCSSGYRGKGCENDINECLNNNGGCQHTCINTIGNFTCSCLTGYQLGRDLLSCDPLRCPTLLAPTNGYIECSRSPVVVGSVCNFTCSEDYDLLGSSQRLCLSNTTWNGTLTSCQIKTCPQLLILPNSTLVQSCSTSVNSTCLLGCASGYRHDNGVLFEQTCTIVDGVAGWTKPEICQALCAPGTVSDTGYEPCHKCNISYYQLHYGRKSCLPCFNGTNITSCKKDYCEQDHYSVSGFKPCTKCAQGYYQSLRGQTTCQLCDYNGTVPTCVEAQCQPGFTSSSGLKPCSACLNGSYQLHFGQRYCNICLPSTVHIDACNSSLCKEDYYSQYGVEPCLLCKNGYYQPLRGQNHCIKCSSTSQSLQCQSDINPCHLPLITGSCNVTSKRYFFNKTSGICEAFKYKGCQSNDNNFYNQHDCEKKCGSCPPTCTYNFCYDNKSAICSMSPLPTNDTNCPGGCRLSNCKASYFAPNPISLPVIATADCVSKNQCVVAGTSVNSTCTREWGKCVYKAYHSSNLYVNYKRTPENFRCWEYNCQ